METRRYLALCNNAVLSALYSLRVWKLNVQDQSVLKLKSYRQTPDLEIYDATRLMGTVSYQQHQCSEAVPMRHNSSNPTETDVLANLSSYSYVQYVKYKKGTNIKEMDKNKGKEDKTEHENGKRMKNRVQRCPQILLGQPILTQA
ncbi:hypothetical protein Tco_0445748 [Tanacetum coccineum]